MVPTLLLAAATALQAGQQGVFRGGIDGVRLDVIVTGPDGPVMDLAPAHFEVLDNGVPQKLDAVSQPGQVAAMIVLDTSASVRFGTRARARRTVPAGFPALIDAARIVVAMLESADEVGLLTFGSSLARPVPPTRGPEAVLQALEGLADLESVEPFSPVWEAVVAGAASVGSRPGRPVVVLLSDGIDSAGLDPASWIDQRGTEQALQRTGVTVDFVAVPPTLNTRDALPPGPHQPETIARATGGERFDAHDEDLARKLAARLHELRASYVITYTPQGVGRDDGWHDVEIRLVGREGTVRARPGYFAGGDIP
jgi:hypothetical protein